MKDFRDSKLFDFMLGLLAGALIVIGAMILGAEWWML